MQIFLEWCEERSIETPVIDMCEDKLNRHIARFVHELGSEERWGRTISSKLSISDCCIHTNISQGKQKAGG